MLLSRSIFSTFSLLYTLSSGHPQSVRHINGISIQWKVGKLSFQGVGTSITSARFLLFQKSRDMACDGLPILALIQNPICMIALRDHFKSPLDENGLICQGQLRGQGNLETWFTCDKYMKPPKPLRGKSIQKEEKHWLKWRIFAVQDGDYTAPSTLNNVSSSKVQWNVDKEFHSVRLEIKRTDAIPESAMPSDLDTYIKVFTALYNVTENLDCQEYAFGESYSGYHCELKDKPNPNCDVACNLPGVLVTAYEGLETVSEWVKGYP